MPGRWKGPEEARMGRRPPRIRLPRAAVLPLAYAAEGIALVTGREPFLTLDGLRMAKDRMFFTSAKAARELGFEARPALAAMADAIASFRARGMIPEGATPRGVMP